MEYKFASLHVLSTLELSREPVDKYVHFFRKHLAGDYQIIVRTEVLSFSIVLLVSRKSRQCACVCVRTSVCTGGSSATQLCRLSDLCIARWVCL